MEDIFHNLQSTWTEWKWFELVDLRSFFSSLQYHVITSFSRRFQHFTGQTLFKITTKSEYCRILGGKFLTTYLFSGRNAYGRSTEGWIAIRYGKSWWAWTKQSQGSGNHKMILSFVLNNKGSFTYYVINVWNIFTPPTPSVINFTHSHCFKISPTH